MLTSLDSLVSGAGVLLPRLGYHDGGGLGKQAVRLQRNTEADHSLQRKSVRLLHAWLGHAYAQVRPRPRPTPEPKDYILDFILEVKRRKEKKIFFTYTWDTLTKKLRIEYLISIMLRCRHPERRFPASYKTPIIVYIILSITVIISNHSKLLSPSGGLRSPEVRGGKAK